MVIKYNLLLLLLVSVGLFPSSRPTLGQNFIGVDSDIRQEAEKFRIKIAEFWVGERFPDWSKPCRITTKIRNNLSGGATTFSFIDGQVVGWSMSIEGTHRAMIEDCIPHEVNHTILATIVRRPITRWVDEGVSTLWETEKAKRRFFHQAYNTRHSPGQVFRLFDASEYPHDINQVVAMYATGYTLIEWILTQHDKDTLLEFIKDERKPSLKFHDYFSVTPQVAKQRWLHWLEANYKNPITYFGYRYEVKKVNSSLPTMHVATAKWCGPCRQFWFDMRTDSGFREAVLARVNLVEVDSKLQSQWIQNHNVQAFPSFFIGENLAFQGYGGGIKQRKYAFINQLDSAIKNNQTIPKTVIHQPKIDLGEPTPFPTFDADKKNVENELSAAKERDVKLGSAIAGLNSKLNDLKQSQQSSKPKNRNNLDDVLDGNLDEKQQQPQPEKPIEKVKDVAIFGAKTYLALKYGGALAGVSAATGFIGWWFGKRVDQKHEQRNGGDLEFTQDEIKRNFEAIRKKYPGYNVQDATLAKKYQEFKEDIELHKKRESEQGGGQQECQVPFPRHLDEADQLRKIRQSEGRVAALDALVGMIFDDEVKLVLENSDSDDEKQYIRTLRDEIMDRVDQIAPIYTPQKGDS